MTRLGWVAIATTGIALALGSGAGSATAARRHQAEHPRHAQKQKAAPFRCAAVRPARLQFRRQLGETSGTLSWSVPRSAATRARGRRAAAWRVSRDGRVVVQTTKRTLKVNVAFDQRHRFVVTALDSRRRARRCSAAARVEVRYRMPGAPRFLAVSGDESGLLLTWQPGEQGDGGRGGYRLLRDGVTVGQTNGTSWRLAAAPNRTYSFAVVAVDGRGRTSAPTAPVTTTTSHAPPTPPGGLQAVSVSENAIGASWQPSTVRAGRVTGYRILRDGVVVRQLDATSTVLDNLAPSTDYRVSVIAIDDSGYASEPAVADTRTQDPVPTSGHAHAFLLASTDQSFADFRAHYRQIGVVHPTYFDCTAAVALEGKDDPLVTQWAQARSVTVLPRINCQRTAVVHRILTDPATRASWLDQLTALAADHAYDGISLDFEAGAASDRAAYTAFVQELAQRLHAAGRRLALSVSPKVRDILTHPRSGIFDYPQLAQSADYLFLMAWGIHWSTSDPGPQDDIGWVRQIVDYVATIPQHEKFIFGTNLYGLDWPGGGGPGNTATAYEYQDLTPLLQAANATVRLDPLTDNNQALYTDAAGVAHEVWFPDADTTARRIRLAEQAGLGGVGFWRLGREDQRIWDDPLLAPGASW
ncbi:glycosyl hydrolase family 18 protein [Conexibacter sp. CPCC 206217]|uniref:glycosyl hydrolase family 18 protein n=1 Tax=Conexibacter sp. CPCC 206217 TaxID=3064574 RepID=UPI00271BAD2F|nr:glycosyl hydrolase family 18 protein [Conexibacter sp. CPCC 206217]MDO8209682.1 glycosyl hydrolase family 18 protein [Conexibacter sp. CPCC 206217]